jgi:hypothetical protein
MAEDKRKLLIDVFGRMKQRILWKWETEDMADKPANVMLSKWLPQQDVLGHPKVRLFVSHGGQSSCQESLCHQKPMVGDFVVCFIISEKSKAKKSVNCDLRYLMKCPTIQHCTKTSFTEMDVKKQNFSKLRPKFK